MISFLKITIFVIYKVNNLNVSAMNKYLSAALILLSLSTYAATGSAKDGPLFILVVIVILAIPLALDFVIRFIVHKVREFCK